jgi:hypothetical protein
LDSPDYVREKLAIAVPILANAETVQERLFSAYTSADLHLLQPADFPEHLRDDFRDLQETLTSVEWDGAEGVIAVDHGAIRANTSVMSDDEAEGWTKMLADMFIEITSPRAR